MDRLPFPNPEKPDLYDSLAPFYERYWGAAFLTSAVSLFQRKLATRLRPNSHILDLCCGTGQFASWLARRGYAVTGVDGSGAMLEYARKRVPNARLYRADIRNLHLHQKFSAAVCFYNSLNQCLQAESLSAVLTGVYGNLRPGGWFLFDVILDHGYEEYWDTDEALENEGKLCELRYRFDRQRRLAVCRATIRPVDHPCSPEQEVTLLQRPYSVGCLIELMDHAGFQLIAVKPVREGNPPKGRLAMLARRHASHSHSHRDEVRSTLCPPISRFQ